MKCLAIIAILLFAIPAIADEPRSYAVNGMPIDDQIRASVSPDRIAENFRTIPQWIAIATKSRSEKYRREGAGALVGIATRDDIELSDADKKKLTDAAVAMLAMKEVYYRTAGFGILRQHGNTKDHLPIITKAVKTAGPEELASGLMVLSKVGDDSCALMLGNLLLKKKADDEPGAYDRTNAQATIYALRKIGGPTCRKVLEELESRATDDDIKTLVQEALDELDAKKAE